MKDDQIKRIVVGLVVGSGVGMLLSAMRICWRWFYFYYVEEFTLEWIQENVGNNFLAPIVIFTIIGGVAGLVWDYLCKRNTPKPN